jgi:hypothetical protein
VITVVGEARRACEASAAGQGWCYSVDEITRWLPEAGWRFVQHQPLSGTVSLVVAEAV